MADEEEKWYNSDLVHKLGVMGIVVSIGWGIAVGVKGCSEADRIEAEAYVIKKQVEYGMKLRTADLNGNGIADKFYHIDGKIAIVEMDGNAVREMYGK